MLRIASACILVEAEGLHQLGLGLILGADDPDHLVEIEIDGEIAFQHLQPRRDLFQAVLGAPLQHLAAVIEEGLQRLASGSSRRGTSPRSSTFMLSGKRDFQVGLAEQLLHQQFRLDGAALGRQHDADVLGAFVVDVVQQRQLLLLQQFGDALDQLGLLHLIGNFGDDDLIGAARAFFLFPARAHAEAAAAGLVGFGDRGSDLRP